jgi:hypothetical protein
VEVRTALARRRGGGTGFGMRPAMIPALAGNKQS